MTLFGWELQKILKRRSARLALLLVVVWSAAGMLVNVFVNQRYKVSETMPLIAGPEEIANQLAWAQSWQGPLTEEKLVMAQQQICAFYQDPANRNADGELNFEAWVRVMRPLLWVSSTLDSIAGSVYGEDTLEELDPRRLESYYADRHAAVGRWLEDQYPDPADRALFEAQEAAVETPFVYDWYGGQFSVLEVLKDIQLGVCLLLAIALTPLFSGEVQSGVFGLSHCARHGRGKLVGAKLAAALTVAAAVWAVSSGVVLVLQRWFFGTRGLDCPIQLIRPLATAPLTLRDCEGYGLLFGLTCCFGTVAITAALSAVFRTNFAAMVGVAALLVGLPMFGGLLPWTIQQWVALLPTGGDYYELFRQNLYHLAGLRVWSPVLQLTAQPFYLLVGLPLAGWAYLRRQMR